MVKSTILEGDCLEVMKTLENDSIDAIITDPPYGLSFMNNGWDKGVPTTKYWEEALRVSKPGAHLLAFGGTRTYHRLACAIEDSGWEIRDCICWLYGSGFPKSQNLGGGLGTAIKPAFEPIIMARKPFKGTVAANVCGYGTGALNIDGCRIGTDVIKTCAKNHATSPQSGLGKTGFVGCPESEHIGRWPANLIHDGTEEILRGFPETNQGSAARFFYCAKASRAERGKDNIHPTVKPLTLMRYLCKLITPPSGLILDPFVGSGTTGVAAKMEGMDFIGIELNPEYVEIARIRIDNTTP